jgi:hypothetical protein
MIDKNKFLDILEQAQISLIPSEWASLNEALDNQGPKPNVNKYFHRQDYVVEMQLADYPKQRAIQIATTIEGRGGLLKAVKKGDALGIVEVILNANYVTELSMPQVQLCINDNFVALTIPTFDAVIHRLPPNIYS